ncbi:MAG: serine hydroxymethyltransferase [Candidatus Heimdallarchaeota archaeon]|nr:serine hydroxymethyltransferase [Candidatus Heimdallarchaeota archaeon]
MKLQHFLELLENHKIFRKDSINLIASENYASPFVRAILSSDLGNRYSSDYYGGTKFIQQIINKTESFIRELFDADYAIVSPLSGNMCDLALILGLTKSGNKIMSVEAGDSGGYPINYEFFNRKYLPFHFSKENMNILVEESIEAIKKLKPKLVIFGSSFFPFPHPVKEITQEFEKRKTIHFAFDGSHVLGLIAGKQFQDPLREGSPILVGSTHKSFPGPQGGLIVTNDMEQYETLSSTFDIDLENGIKLTDNIHAHRIAALGVAALEMLEFGKEYASQIIKNTKTLASTLDNHGIPVKFKHLDFSESHQVILDISSTNEINMLRERAENLGLLIDSGIRLGTAEITRMGMKELEVKEIGEILARIYHNDISEDMSWRIKDFARIFSSPAYCFNNIGDLPF